MMLGLEEVPATKLYHMPPYAAPGNFGYVDQQNDPWQDHLQEDASYYAPVNHEADSTLLSQSIKASSSTAEAWLNGTADVPKKSEVAVGNPQRNQTQAMPGRIALLATSPNGPVSYAPSLPPPPPPQPPQLPNTPYKQLQPMPTIAGHTHMEVTSPQPPVNQFHDLLRPMPVARDDLAAQKRINKELLDASKENSPFRILEVVLPYLEDLNGVNLSTTVHRVARSCSGSSKLAEQIKRTQEAMVQSEIENVDGSMPVNCASIMAWSCASLKVFRPNLFKALAGVGARGLRKCQTYEVTNMLWAFAELCKHQPRIAMSIEEELRKLSVSASEVILRRGRGAWKIQVMISALASWSMFPTQVRLMEEVFTDLVQELAERSNELEAENTLPIAMAFEHLRTEYRTVYDDLVVSMKSRYPDFAPTFIFNKKKRSIRRRKHPEWTGSVPVPRKNCDDEVETPAR
ncbi:hypothetical protein AK812_SmicGene24231 [Symbiodinium microadriaticum]|uniref:Uncharacterized protein n=1 Tax=Symbiodinium microadriaticum TaxID=2951 RepID=A0A1Q9DF89_SYMMI|nr:hypothetical protein AK812_SmicGene24231 [Symbiodinium microadriaticum]